MLLIITNREDFTADYLITSLLEQDLAYFRINSEDLASSEITFSSTCGKITSKLASQRAAVELDDVCAIWYRRAIRPSLGRTTERYRPFEAAELRHLTEGVLAGADALWVNPLEVSELAERKVFQLRVSSECGLSVPDTVVSTDPAQLRRFAAGRAPLVCKPLSTGLLEFEDGMYAIHAEVVENAELADYDSRVPTLLQKRILGTDVRVTVIGTKMFPVEILKPKDSPVDWRKVPDDVSYSVCCLPEGVTAGIRWMMKRLGLNFGAFDFIRAEDGSWTFLEVNPAGEWAWLEVELGLPMRGAFIELFYGQENTEPG